MQNFPDLRDLQIFSVVCRLRSFAKTATELGASTSYISKRIHMLEREMGATLLHRTSRRVTPTEDGEAILKWSVYMLDAATEMHDAVSDIKTEPRGDLRISSSFRLGRNLLAPALSQLSSRYPRLDISLIVMDRPVDLIAESIDLDIRIGKVSEPHLIAHKLAASTRVLCASADYLARRGMPQTPDDLLTHSCLVFRERDQPFGTWRLRNRTAGKEAEADVATIKVGGSLSSNNNDIIWTWALGGHGIMRASAWDCAQSLQQGQLIRVLPEYDWPADIYAVTTARLSASAKVRVCVEFLQNWFASEFEATAPLSP
ncbi:LysR family transcriptional regulator [Pandoraea capi]|uniref:LysR family transcriptional regulator n=1 Tax=Pandoraea capi TaxID=2508286 RepID=A0ABY6W7K3_9BURK|nr:LysR family transcriptional regulator [Pandoraea capi]VVE27056.1 LysR family transcriptional regulator [Pandoraea capi]